LITVSYYNDIIGYQHQVVSIILASYLIILYIQLENKLKSYIVTQFFKSYRMLFKMKHYTNISVLIAVYFALSHSYLTYSKI